MVVRSTARRCADSGDGGVEVGAELVHHAEMYRRGRRVQRVGRRLAVEVPAVAGELVAQGEHIEPVRWVRRARCSDVSDVKAAAITSGAPSTRKPALSISATNASRAWTDATASRVNPSSPSKWRAAHAAAIGPPGRAPGIPGDA